MTIDYANDSLIQTCIDLQQYFVKKPTMDKVC